jgi:hypothetical protein
MKPKAKTLQERFGFHDEELSTPKHDEMMVWLDENIATIVADLFPKEWTESEIKAHERLVEKARRNWLERAKRYDELGPEDEKKVRLLKAEIEHWRALGDSDKQRVYARRLEEFYSSIGPQFPHPGDVPSRPACKILDVKWESPIKENNFVIGFPDLCVGVGKPQIYLDGVEGSNIKPRWVVGTERENLFFEVKPTIRSLGEIMRQINFYRAYESSRFLVVCQDDRFRQLLQTQGIGFVKYPG